MTTLIITVGTRQVGWKCKDGIVRSLGIDGERGIPHKHIDELYRELNIERGNYPENDVKGVPYSWSVRHLGEQLYEWCEVHKDYSSVELMMDGNLITQEAKNGLNHIILWGTDQPEKVSWFHRRLDTIWVAELMAGKIRQTWPDIMVDVWIPKIPCDNGSADIIRQELEGFLFKYIEESIADRDTNLAELLIATKGSTPIISSSLEICAAALSRQYPVSQAKPNEPTPAFDDRGGARVSEIYIKQSVGEFFWPLERQRIISAWQRGDFSEAKVWLEAHIDRHQAVYQLSEKLALASNGELNKALKDLRSGWINSKITAKVVTKEQLQQWQELLATLLPQQDNIDSKSQQVWEQLLIIELMCVRENYTNSFMLFAQLIERVLSIRSKSENWVGHRHLTPPDNYHGNPQAYKFTLGGLIKGWKSYQNIADNTPNAKKLDEILDLRNNLVHEGQAIDERTLHEVLSIPPDRAALDEVIAAMIETLKMVGGKKFQYPQILLLRSLYHWGFDTLKAG